MKEQNMRPHHLAGKIGVAGCALLIVATMARADIAPLQSGSVRVSTLDGALPGGLSPAAGAYFDLTIDYAIYAPGTFVGDFNAFSGFTAPNSSDYVYAYQIHNNGSAEVSRMGINLAGGTIDSMGYDTSGLVTPLSGRTNSDKFLFTFSPGSLTQGQSSAFLFVSSPDRWALAPVSVLNGGLSASGQLLSPGAMVIPAPSAALLALIGVGLISALMLRMMGKPAKIS
jgi:hypothetical protein